MTFNDQNVGKMDGLDTQFGMLSIINKNTANIWEKIF